MTAPLLYAWNGHAMEPLNSQLGVARRAFKVGGVYRLDVVEHRSMDSHKQLFAVVNEAFANLPDALREDIGVNSEDELRKWALTHTGHRDVREYHAKSYTEALRFMRFERTGSYVRLEYFPETKVVRVFTPHSMQLSQMDRRTFQKAKDDIFIVLAERLGIDVDTLIKNAGKAA